MSVLPPTKTSSATPDSGRSVGGLAWMGQIPLPPELRRVRWRTVLLVTAVAAVVIAAVVCVLPPTYETTASFVPVRDQRGPGTDGSAGIAAALGIGTAAVGDPTATYMEVLRSRSLVEAVITRPIRDPDNGRVTTYLDELRIRDRRPDRRLFLAVREFQRHLRVLMDRNSGVFRVSLSGSNPGLIKTVVNDLVAELQRYTVKTRSETAGRNREFVELEKAETKVLLEQAEAELNQFRERNLRIGNSPQLLLEQNRLARNLRVQEEIYTALARQYENAKLDEARSTPMILVIDPAIRPPFRTAPRRLFLFVLGVVAVFFTSVAVSIWLVSPEVRPERG